MLTWNSILLFIKHGNPEPPRKVVKTQDEWQRELEPDVFYITRKKGTERPFSSQSCSIFTPGQYQCACCGELLFDASEKFDSRSGWPSFTQPIKPERVAYIGDDSHGMQRVEIVCNVCDGHLGHVFPDGPEPSGLRYCVNALSLVKVE
ncbi:peptide-methionine (R)-S-oxide reductase MsrB [Pseudoalteromonas xiamenensis]|uniref:peptide-methionine (R)-S-oxide reductase MsrB n=1 Tax=Pseudoalteromonas xiamenensis TaxID=882626 RepID=UPI0027E4F6E3|nr:peptide-methionine (R)-S-oxide reductase MsrB [Pseudoalteromonas xiamenensis]WMN59469.1 peptide-methionine (R)-S-oxide reductase MsrB [Pseudoalteromonas xiamenensis]